MIDICDMSRAIEFCGKCPKSINGYYIYVVNGINQRRDCFAAATKASLFQFAGGHIDMIDTTDMQCMVEFHGKRPKSVNGQFRPIADQSAGRFILRGKRRDV